MYIIPSLKLWIWIIIKIINIIDLCSLRFDDLHLDGVSVKLGTVFLILILVLRLLRLVFQQILTQGFLL